MMKPVVLCFSGLDPSGGAGIQADIEALAGTGCHCAPVVTALTVQDTRNVQAFEPVESTLIIQQARAILEDMPVSAFKIGFTGSVEIIEAIHSIIIDYPETHVILDPIIDASGGGQLSSAQMVVAMESLLLPISTIATPNTYEAGTLATGADTLAACAGEILDSGCQYVLITGTDARSPKVINRLYDAKGLIKKYEWERLAGQYHGSGCTLAASLAGYIAHGGSITGIIELAQTFTWQSLKHSQRLGMGQQIPNRLFWANSKDSLQ